MSLHDKQRSSLVTLKGQGAPDAISLTPGQEVAQIEAELRTLGLRRGHKCPFCRLLVPDKLRWKTQGGKQDCPLMYRGNCPGAKTGVNALGRRLRHLREAAEAEGVAEAVAEGLVSAYQGAPTPEVAEEIVWSTPAAAEEVEDARKERCACVVAGQRCRKLVLGADDWDVSLGDWDPERYCSQHCALAERARAEKVLESAPEPAPSTKAKPLQRSHDGGLAGMIAACAKPPDEEKAEETSSEDDADESSADAASSGDEAPPRLAPAPGRVAGVVRKFDGHRGFIRLKGRPSDVILFEDNVRGGVALQVGDRVEFKLKPGKKHPSAVDVVPLAPAPSTRPAADAPPSGEALVSALHAWIVGQGKTEINGGLTSMFFEAHPAIAKPPKGKTGDYINAHGGGLLTYVKGAKGINKIVVGEGAAPAPPKAPPRVKAPPRAKSREAPGPRTAGTVAWWKGVRGSGHGFLIRAAAQEGLFVHESGLGAGLLALKTGDRVTFHVGTSPVTGRDTAVDVARAAPAPRAPLNPPLRGPMQPVAAHAANGAGTHRAAQHEVEAITARVAAGLFAAEGPLSLQQFAARFKRQLREHERRLDASSQQQAWAYAQSTLVTLDRARRVVGVRDDAGAAAAARAAQRGHERRAWGPGGGVSEDQLLARALEALRRDNYSTHLQPPSALDAAGEDAALMRVLEESRQSYEREQAQPYVKAQYAPPTYPVAPASSSSFYSAPAPPAPHHGGSSSAEFEARIVAAGLARILPDLKKEEICDLDTLRSLEEDDLKELGLAVGARVKLMRLIKSVAAEASA